MTTNLKRSLSIIMAAILCMTSIFSITTGTAHATVDGSGNVGVSHECPDDAELNPGSRTVNIPSEVMDLRDEDNKRYNFAGESITQPLYTNYKFKGGTSYKIYVKNTGSKKITVKAKSRFKTYSESSVSGGESVTFTVSDMSKNTEFYIRFSGTNYSFKGYIKIVE